jgi:hypothetical protein
LKALPNKPANRRIKTPRASWLRIQLYPTPRPKEVQVIQTDRFG